MERNVQIKSVRRGAEHLKALLLVLMCVLSLSGCGKKEKYEYSFEERIFTPVSSDMDSEVKGFASDICVLNAEDNEDSGLTCETAAVFHLNGGNAVFQKNADQRMNPASTTKIMTALLALRYADLSDEVTAGNEVIIEEAGSSMCGIQPGETMTMEQLLYGLMIPSGNDAANAIAVHMAGSVQEFAEMMNKEAKRIGAVHTHYSNANGLTAPDHYTTAYDLYLMFHEALQYPLFRDIIGSHSYTAEYRGADGNPKTAVWNVGNYYMNGKRETPDGLHVFGGKTGTTSAAGYCLVMGSEDSTGEEYVSIVMKASSRDGLYDNMTRIISNIVK